MREAPGPPICPVTRRYLLMDRRTPLSHARRRLPDLNPTAGVDRSRALIGPPPPPPHPKPEPRGVASVSSPQDISSWYVLGNERRRNKFVNFPFGKPLILFSPANPPVFLPAPLPGKSRRCGCPARTRCCNLPPRCRWGMVVLGEVKEGA